MKYSKSDQKIALDNLKSLKKNMIVYTILRHTSSSGMLRIVDVLQVGKNGLIYNLGWSVAVVLELPYDRNQNGVKVGGVGMDMGFHLIYSLSSVLFGDGYALKQRWI